MVSSLGINWLVLVVQEALVIVDESVEASEMLALGVAAQAEVAKDDEGEENGESDTHPFHGVGIIYHISFEFGIAVISGLSIIHVREYVNEVIRALTPSGTAESEFYSSKGLGEGKGVVITSSFCPSLESWALLKSVNSIRRVNEAMNLANSLNFTSTKLISVREIAWTKLIAMI